ncbi:hypothetical protein J2764_004483 [Agrobacterium tumefaciens]|nr:hypothetical protein [Agrobacterium tumefaciens]
MNRNIHDTSDIGKLFPIDSQTSDTDKLFLKNVINLMSEKFGSFTYIELGSFLGRAGSGNLNSGDKWNFCLTSA